jgi:hypothetical protein
MAKAKRKASQEEQSARFVQKAREAEVDESGKTFERALRKIVPKKRTSNRAKAKARPANGP